MTSPRPQFSNFLCRLGLVGLLALTFAAGPAPTGPAPAAAQQGGVVVDPESPTGKEYAIPLDRARRQAAAGRQGAGGIESAPAASTAPAPLFGEGVGPEDPASAPQRDGDGEVTGAAGRDGSGPGGTRSVSGVGADSERRPAAGAATRPGAPDGGSSALAFLAIGGGVLLIGLLAGLAIRRAARLA